VKERQPHVDLDNAVRIGAERLPDLVRQNPHCFRVAPEVTRKLQS
jgi:hypothetical protein